MLMIAIGGAFAFGLTQEAIERRRSYIGGSDASSIVAGGDEWRKLWLVKTGRAQGEDLSNVLAVQLGIFTEPFNIFWYEKQTGRKVERNGIVQTHPEYDFIACTLDGESTTSEGQPCSFQAKHVGRAGDQLTLRYTAQCVHEALCLGYDWWCLSVLVGNSKWELTEQEVDPFFAADYVERCKEFWDYVVADREPPEANQLPVPAPKKLRVVRLEEGHEWPNWGGAMMDHFGTFARTHAAHQAHEIAKREIKDLMPADVGLVTYHRIKALRDRAGAVRISLSKEEPNA
jgi:hypothetical protein